MSEIIMVGIALVTLFSMLFLVFVLPEILNNWDDKKKEEENRKVNNRF